MDFFYMLYSRDGVFSKAWDVVLFSVLVYH